MTYFKLCELERGYDGVLEIPDQTLCFVLKGALRVMDGKCDMFVNSSVNSGFFAMKKGATIKIKVIESVSFLIFGFKMPLFIMGVQPIHNFAKLRMLQAPQKILLPIKPLLYDYLSFIRSSVKQNIKCKHFGVFSSAWLFFLMKNLYSPLEIHTLLSPFYESITNEFRLFIEYNYKKVDSVKELAEIGNYSLSDFKRKFNQEYGVPPSKWLNERRKTGILEALSQPNFDLDQIIKDFRFSSLDYFHKYCKREFGHSVKEITLGHSPIL